MIRCGKNVNVITHRGIRNSYLKRNKILDEALKWLIKKKKSSVISPKIPGYIKN
jgi:hypothetical protein